MECHEDVAPNPPPCYSILLPLIVDINYEQVPLTINTSRGKKCINYDYAISLFAASIKLSNPDIPEIIKLPVQVE